MIERHIHLNKILNFPHENENNVSYLVFSTSRSRNAFLRLHGAKDRLRTDVLIKNVQSKTGISLGISN